MIAALGDTRISGVKTTIDICTAIMRDGRFREGGIAIDYLPAFVPPAAAALAT